MNDLRSARVFLPIFAPSLLGLALSTGCAQGGGDGGAAPRPSADAAIDSNDGQTAAPLEAGPDSRADASKGEFDAGVDEGSSPDTTADAPDSSSPDAPSDASPDGSSDAVSYDALSPYGVWRVLATPPHPILNAMGVWTGSGALFYPRVDSASAHPAQIYDPTTDGWVVLNAPASGTSGVGVAWTGNGLFVFDDFWSSTLGTNDQKAFLYDLATDKFVETSVTARPKMQSFSIVSWAGDRVIAVDDGDGGMRASALAGGQYDPKTDLWTSIDLGGAPLGGDSTSYPTGTISLWTGSEVLTFSGFRFTPSGRVSVGALYSPSTGKWRPMSTLGMPSPLGVGYVSAWTGDTLYLWNGGYGYAYSYPTDTWTMLPSSGLSSRENAVGVWTGTELVVFGGEDSSGTALSDGARWVPSLGMWRILSSDKALMHCTGDPVWTGTEIIVECSDAYGTGTYTYAWHP